MKNQLNETVYSSALHKTFINALEISCSGLKKIMSCILFLIGVPLAFFVIFIFEELNNKLIMAAVALVYIFGALGGFGEDIQNLLSMHIPFFTVPGVFCIFYFFENQIKQERKAEFEN